jgi:hypothetical protein
MPVSGSRTELAYSSGRAMWVVVSVAVAASLYEDVGVCMRGLQHGLARPWRLLWRRWCLTVLLVGSGGVIGGRISNAGMIWGRGTLGSAIVVGMKCGLATLGSATVMAFGVSFGGGSVNYVGEGLPGFWKSSCMCRSVAACITSPGGTRGWGLVELMVLWRLWSSATASSSLVGVDILQ